MVKGKLYVGLINGSEKVVDVNTFDFNRPLKFINAIVAKDYFTMSSKGELIAFRNSNVTYIHFKED